MTRQTTPPRGEALPPHRRVFIRGLALDAHIGVYDFEQGVTQPVTIDLFMDVTEPADRLSDSIEDVVCYNKMTQGIIDIIAEGHIKLVETLAERIAALALSHPMVIDAQVRVEKPNAIGQAIAAGVEIQRTKR